LGCAENGFLGLVWDEVDIFKRSGYGKDLSSYALEDYTVPRHVMIKH